MNILLVDNGTTLLERLKTAIPRPYTVCSPEDLGDLNPNEFDAIVLSGSSTRSALADISLLSTEIELIKGWRKPMLGICFGFELIALAFGGSLKKLSQEHKGSSDISVIEGDPVFGGKVSFTAYEHHTVALDRVPQDFKVLATSHGEISAIRHETLPLYAFQFHPEHDDAASDGASLLESFFAAI